jgi:hypothetical protein
MKAELKELLETVAGGVWCQQSNDFYSYSQCAFCWQSPESEHEPTCPVVVARSLLEKLQEIDM